MAAFDRLSEELRRRIVRAAGTPFVVGVAGGVAAGKSTFASALADAAAAWPDAPQVVSIATDGFLFPNAVLAERGLALRKGFPESYDIAALRAALSGLKSGARVALPRYSHVTYDVEPNDALAVERPDLLVLDGLHLAQVERDGGPRLIDFLIYLDAEEAHIESWFAGRLLPLMEAGRDDPNSFYFRFRDFDDAARRDFAARVWQGINLPNLREHIVKDRDAADAIVRKRADHAIADVVLRTRDA